MLPRPLNRGSKLIEVLFIYPRSATKWNLWVFPSYNSNLSVDDMDLNKFILMDHILSDLLITSDLIGQMAGI